MNRLKNLRAMASSLIHGKDLRTIPIHRADDVHLVSYPKSGNTWVRCMVAGLISERPLGDMMDVHRLIPDEDNFPPRQLARLPSPRVIKSHRPVDAVFRRVVYVIRDPRDVLVSFFHHARKFGHIPADLPIDRFAGMCLDGTLFPHGTWKFHVGGWLGAREGDADFLLLRYEDMLADRMAAVRAIAGFCRIPATEERLVTACEVSGFESMRALEQRSGGAWPPNRTSRTATPFIRSGRSGEGKDVLPPQILERITAEWGVLMRRCGYATDG